MGAAGVVVTKRLPHTFEEALETIEELKNDLNAAEEERDDLKADLEEIRERELEVIRCTRCDVTFLSYEEDAKYCSKACEMGYVPMPYQTIESQNLFYNRARVGMV